MSKKIKRCFAKFVRDQFPDEAELSPQGEKIYNMLEARLKTPRTIMVLHRHFGKSFKFNQAESLHKEMEELKIKQK